VRANEDVDRDLGRVNFVTAFVRDLDPSRRVLTCVRAGHNPPLLFNPAARAAAPAQAGRLGLGIMSEELFAPTIKPMEIAVQPATSCCSTRTASSRRATTRTSSSASSAPPDPRHELRLSTALILSNLAHALDDFAGHRVSEDDITALCVRFQ
jgi:serine phosphatase RsbU (regulator of sigma subunit)